MAKALILTGDAGESLEVMYPYRRMIEEGYEVDIAAPSKKKLQFVVRDFVDGFDTYTEKPGYTWEADLAFADVDPSDYVALTVPGGRAPHYIRNDADCQRIVSTSSRTRSRWPSCATRRWCWERPACSTAAYPALEPDVPAAGATFVDGGGVVDGMMVSARARPDHPSWMREFVRILRERAPVEGAKEPARVG